MAKESNPSISPTSLYLIPTPIGNLEDMTLRAIRILKEVDTILAEDTRVTGHLLKHFDISSKLESNHTFNEHGKLTRLIERMKGGEKIALVSDAGTPGISDPGFLLSRECVREGLKIEALPGATAFVPALLKSGFPVDRFVFEGFLPQKKGRNTAIKQIVGETRTSVLYESPFRVVKTLEAILELAGPERKVSASRELTKLFEETITGTVEEVLLHFKTKEPKGEFVLVVEGKG